MNPIAKMLLDMARFYDQPLDERQVDLYVRVLAKFPSEQVLMAGREYIEDVRNTRFPIPPHKIMEKYLPKEPEAKDIGRETATRIRHAITKFGWPSPLNAREYIGDAAWSVVERFGGWQHICECLGVEIQESTFMAQVRDAVESQVNLGRAGIDLSKSSLDQPALPQRVSDLVKDLSDKLNNKPKEIK